MSYVLEGDATARPATPPALTQVDPRYRVVAVVAFAITVVALHDFAALLIALFVSAAVLLHGRLPVANTIRQVVTVDMFMIFVILSLPFTTPGETAFTLFGLEASKEGIGDAFRIALKANAIVLMMLVLVGTIGPVRLGHALSRLKVPPMFVHLMLFTVRYIEVLNEEYQRLRTAMRTRGFRPGTNMHTIRTLGYLVGMLLIRAFDRSERVLQAMRCRGFTGAFHLIDESRPAGLREGLFAIGTAAVLAALIYVEVRHGAFVSR
ncbi:cobalt ECF transporter T component CbiQ [Pseudoroseicyclus tamaricis]|uniref:Cobalt ECF transporter T component CbiQ n=1 Tax=Pseudoroseicyclus tamaricis TaxID=2705421 RepID=A0A6B2JGI2_9RHOB|nr:cobalt ECF transporter T component CbiQ [Pseudoroseicyclus tamaricis]NDV00273.1 cobalt ECF transporter T component CbiQ [Pseudoroseicyclus tamaricis]